MCKLEKPLDAFSLKSGKPQWQCKECHSQYRREHYNKNKQKYIDKAIRVRNQYRDDYYEWLSTQACADCGINDIRVLEADHLYDKSFNISKKVGMVTLETLMVELVKCDIVCANCHRIRTCERAGWARANKYAGMV